MSPAQPAPLKPPNAEPVRKRVALQRASSTAAHGAACRDTGSSCVPVPRLCPARPYSPGAAALTLGRPAPPCTRRRLGARSAPRPADRRPAALTKIKLTSFSSCPLPPPLRRPVRGRGRHHPTGAAAVPREPRRRARVMDNVRCVVRSPAEGPGRPRWASPRVSGFTGSWQPWGALLEERACLPTSPGNGSAGTAPAAVLSPTPPRSEATHGQPEILRGVLPPPLLAPLCLGCSFRRLNAPDSSTSSSTSARLSSP